MSDRLRAANDRLDELAETVVTLTVAGAFVGVLAAERWAGKNPQKAMAIKLLAIVGVTLLYVRWLS